MLVGKYKNTSGGQAVDLKNLDHLYIIAEIGCNYNGNTEIGLKMIDEAKRCGAQAVKFQFFSDTNLCTNKYLDDLDSGKVKLENVDKWESKDLGLSTIREQTKAFMASKNQLKIFQEYSKRIGIDFGCTPADEHGVEFLASIKSDFIKLSSMDADNPRMIKAAIKTRLPIIISTGMSTLAEIDEIYNIFKKANYDNFSLLHCVSIYPPRNEIVNLNFMNTLQQIYDCEIGYSDHTLGYSISLAAIAKGAKIESKDKYLMIACREGHLHIAQYLIEKGANIEAKDINQKTPLHIASSSGKTDVVKYLVSQGANKTVKNKLGKAPYDVVCISIRDKSQRGIIRELLK